MLNLKEKKFGKVIITGESIKRKHNRRSWNYICECGNKGITTTDELRSGRVKSCGCLRVGKGRYNWKGNKVGYGVLHKWVKRNLVKPNICSLCNKKNRVELTNISGEYKRDLKDWEWLCRKCHMIKDGRLKKFMDTNNIKGHTPWNKGKKIHRIGSCGAVILETRNGGICAECGKKVEPCETKPGWCCACEADMAVFENQLKEMRIKSYTQGRLRCLQQHDYGFKPDIKREAREELKKEILEKLKKTHKENYAFMIMSNEKGELEDWCIPCSEILKIIKKLK